MGLLKGGNQGVTWLEFIYSYLIGTSMQKSTKTLHWPNLNLEVKLSGFEDPLDAEGEGRAEDRRAPRLPGEMSLRDA